MSRLQPILPEAPVACGSLFPSSRPATVACDELEEFHPEASTTPGLASPSGANDDLERFQSNPVVVCDPLFLAVAFDGLETPIAKHQAREDSEPPSDPSARWERPSPSDALDGSEGVHAEVSAMGGQLGKVQLSSGSRNIEVPSSHRSMSCLQPLLPETPILSEPLFPPSSRSGLIEIPVDRDPSDVLGPLPSTVARDGFE
eukprot:CAMPEP_0180526846 /NCGR_PEP_ID=MMETSP1036_2-20121128/59914_1 /TAXON_ID=632150 /ORGANISM="Azadinium spinosum, Strain 3D9" /LENGTH=200 /DNA_ID=CAMNT_0022540229 /DNA_START=184 /DNA_END=786 /DNA_ORIENTATION=+